jgi:hypothetical protein
MHKNSFTTLKAQISSPDVRIGHLSLGFETSVAKAFDIFVLIILFPLFLAKLFRNIPIFQKGLLPYEFPGRRPNFFYSPWLDEKKINGGIRINLTNGGFAIILRLILKGRFIRRGLCLQFLSRQTLLGMS